LLIRRIEANQCGAVDVPALLTKIARGKRGPIMPHDVSKIQPPIVAVVDDDPAVCNSLKFSLELEGFSVRTYCGGVELLRAADLAACDCFVVDQKMPHMSGLEVIAKLRDRRVAAPAILIISQPSAALSVRAAKAKVPIVEKPFLGNTLVERIREACARG
jgi:two-component system, LuxR family, response regulator FixJ